MGSNIFCFKVCDPAVAGSKAFCNNVFDRTGCGFVAPAAVRPQPSISCAVILNTDPLDSTRTASSRPAYQTTRTP